MIKTARADIEFKAHTTWEGVALLVDGANAPIDTAGFQARMCIRPSYADAVVLECSTANGRMSVGLDDDDATNLRWSVPPSVTALVPDFGKGVYDIVITDNTGRVGRVLAGFCWYSDQATR